MRRCRRAVCCLLLTQRLCVQTGEQQMPEEVAVVERVSHTRRLADVSALSGACLFGSLALIVRECDPLLPREPIEEEEQTEDELLALLKQCRQRTSQRGEARLINVAVRRE